MARKAGRPVLLGPHTWLVGSSARDPESGTRRYHNFTVHRLLRETQSYSFDTGNAKTSTEG